MTLTHILGQVVLIAVLLIVIVCMAWDLVLTLACRKHRIPPLVSLVSCVAQFCALVYILIRFVSEELAR